VQAGGGVAGAAAVNLLFKSWETAPVSAAAIRTVNVHDAKTHLSRYLAEVAAGGEVIIARAGTPVARIVPVEPLPAFKRGVGSVRREIRVPDDFDTWMQDEIVALFEDGEGRPSA